MSRTSLSSTSSRASDLQYFQEEFGLDLATARLLHRAEKLQEKGRTSQALQYYREVLRAYPQCHEAQMNVDMIERMTATALSESNPVRIPDDAKLTFYSETNHHCSQFQQLKRLADGRTEFVDKDEVAEELGMGGARILFKRAQSDQLWIAILGALEEEVNLFHGRAPVDTDGLSMYTDITITLDGEERNYFANRGTPLELTCKDFVKDAMKAAERLG